MKTLLSLLLIALLSLPTVSFAQERSGGSSEEPAQQEEGKLREFGKEVEKKTEQQRQEERDDDGPSTGQIIGDILFSIFTDVVVPAAVDAALESALDTSTIVRDAGPDVYHTFAQYPYHEEGQGLYKIGGEKDFSLNLKANLHYEGQGFLGGGARLRISPLRYFSAEAQVNLLTERVNLKTDRMMLASFFLNYNLVRENSCAIWLGLGEKILRGAGATADGVAMNLGVEVYPVEPMSFHANVSFGPYTEVFTTANFHTGRVTLFLGYQGFYEGTATLGGLVAGSSFYL